MGFYGNITNTSKTQFQFDKIYANRYEMERSKTTDGIYAGRYVLIEYDIAFQLDDSYRIFLINGKGYKANSEDTSLLIKPGDFQSGDILFTATQKTNSETGYNYTEMVYYEYSVVNGSVALKELVNAEEGPSYTVNYNIDINRYGAGRGYDSTVWQKTYMDGVEKYIMIAELNNVVPTFDVSADAPTAIPRSPHFDTQSTDIYYKLHWQPTWGFRIAEGVGTNKTTSIDANSGKYPSDMNVSYDKNIYNYEAGKNTTEKVIYNGALFFNKAGFDSLKHTTHEATDELAICPTGVSGQTYNKHNGTSDVEAAPDIQEMRMILPSLGNTICKMWDIIYDNNDTTNIRYQDVEWKDVANSKENTDIGGMTRNPKTLAGCINIIHDLMGMIITQNAPELSKAGYDRKWIYKNGDKYYRIHRYPRYQIVDIKNELNKDNYDSDQEYNTAYADALLEKIKNYPDKEWYVVKDASKPNYKVEKINEKASMMLGSNAVIAYKLDTYGYERAELDGFATNLSTINGLILQLKELLENEDSETRDRATVQGTINSLNDIIDTFKDLVPNELVITNNDGKVTTANWTTKQSFTYTNYGGVPTNTKDNSNKENQWIRLDLDGKNNEIKLIHQMHSGIDSTTTASDKNDLTSGSGLNKNTTKDKLALYTPIVDNCGHVVGQNTETVILPYGYKYLSTSAYSGTDANDLYTTITDKTNGDNSSSVTATVSSCEAETTQDKIQVMPVNKWVQTKIINENGTDTIQVAHEVHAINEVAQSTNLNADNVSSLSNNDKITFQDIEFDKAGHAIKNQRHTYTLPYGFKTIIPKAQSIATNNPDVNTAQIVADNTQDTLSIASSNKWIRLSADAATDTLSIGHEVHAFSDAASSGKYYGLTQDESITSLDVDNKFEIPCLKFDEAGHITGARTHTVELPENFSSIGISLSDNNGANKTTGTEGTIIADSLTDKLTISEGNRWINIDADSDNDKITFSHYINTIPSINNSTDYNGSNTKNFTVQELSWDKAGHIITENVHTHTLPDSLKTIAINNNGNNDVNVAPIISNGNLIATTLVDTATIDTGNRWIKMVADPKNKKATIYHAAPGGEANTTKVGNEAPDFGKTFEIPEVKYDEAGHISKVATHTVQLPLPSLNDLSATDSSVVTGISMNDATGAITQTNSDVGNLKLTGYSIATENKDIATTDSINQAFGQSQFRINSLEKSLNAEIEDRKTAIKDESNNRDNAIAQEVSDRNIAIATAIEDLEVPEIKVLPAQTIKTLSETDGKVQVVLQDIVITNDNIDNKAAIGMSKIDGLGKALESKQDAIPEGTYDSFGAAAEVLGTEEDDDTKLTIYGLLKKIEALEKRIKALESTKEPTTPNTKE